MLSFKSISRGLWLGALAGAILAAPAARAADKETSFGFTGPEIFPIDPQISLLHAADLDGDGLTDLIVVNNARSKITLLYNRTGKTNSALPQPGEKREINDLPPDARFRIESIASEKRISSLVVADLNGDGKPDLAYYGEPKELVVLYNQGTNGWSAPKRFPIDDGQLTINALAAGDLNGDHLTDLVLLGENNLYYLRQNPDHTLAEPQKIPFSGEVKAVQVLDINGDGRDDLLLVNWDSPNPFRFRLQNPDGELGPEIYFTLPAIRSYMADDLDGDHKTEVVTIAQNSGRAAVSHFDQKPAEPLSGAFKQGQFQVLPLHRTTRGHRGILWADVNGDGLPDLLVAEPDSGQLSLYLQKPDGSLSAAKTFPTFTGVSQLAVSDWDKPGQPRIFLLSSDEHQVGVTQLDQHGRIRLPVHYSFGRQALGHGRRSLATWGQAEPGRHRRAGHQPLAGHAHGGWKIAHPEVERRLQGHALLHDDARRQPGRPGRLDRFDPVRKDQSPPPEARQNDFRRGGRLAAGRQLRGAVVERDGRGRRRQTRVAAGPEKLRARRGAPARGRPRPQRQTGLELLRQRPNQRRLQRLAHRRRRPLAQRRQRRGLPLSPGRRAEGTDLERAGQSRRVARSTRNLPLPLSDFTALRAVGLGSTVNNSVAFIGVNAVGTLATSGKVWELIMLCDVSVRFNVLGDEVLGSVSDKRSPEDRELLVGFQATEALRRFHHSSGRPA